MYLFDVPCLSLYELTRAVGILRTTLFHTRWGLIHTVTCSRCAFISLPYHVLRCGCVHRRSHVSVSSTLDACLGNIWSSAITAEAFRSISVTIS